MDATYLVPLTAEQVCYPFTMNQAQADSDDKTTITQALTPTIEEVVLRRNVH